MSLEDMLENAEFFFHRAVSAAEGRIAEDPGTEIRMGLAWLTMVQRRFGSG